jgi:hypothetical protein
LNFKLAPMKTTYRTMALQSGQALAIDRHRPASLFVAEGEVLVQAPAAWLGGTVILAPPRRVAGPAALACAEIASITALGAAKIHLEEAVSLLEPLKSAFNVLLRLRPARRTSRPPSLRQRPATSSN